MAIMERSIAEVGNVRLLSGLRINFLSTLSQSIAKLALSLAEA